MSTYIDTSALAKRYLHEGSSDAFEHFVMHAQDELCITPLGNAEFESLLHRRLRLGEIDAAQMQASRRAFERDVQFGVWQPHPFDPAAFSDAVDLIRDFGPLATLDALHLASARALCCQAVASADRQLLRAAEAIGLKTHDFRDPPHA